MLSKGASCSRPSLLLLKISMTNDGLYPAVNAEKPTMRCFAMESDPVVTVFFLVCFRLLLLSDLAD